MSNNLFSQVKESNSTLFQLLSENGFLLDENKFCSNIYFKIKTGAVSAFASKIIFDNNGFKVRRMHKKNTEPKKIVSKTTSEVHYCSQIGHYEWRWFAD